MLAPDLQDILKDFVYTNLPALMNPMSSIVIVTNAPVTVKPSTDVIVVTPEILSLLQTCVLDNFQNVNLPADIQDIARQFFAFNAAVNTPVSLA